MSDVGSNYNKLSLNYVIVFVFFYFRERKIVDYIDLVVFVLIFRKKRDIFFGLFN